jgi:UDP-3-O-[3-hydroxymyristoyl] glucosamine N-acyltransferase
MDIKIITKADLDENNFYKESALVFEGSIKIEPNLGCVRFHKNIYLNGYILTKAGSGIEAGSNIKTGLGIKSGGGIKAGWDIEAGSSIEAVSSIEAGWDIESGGSIKASGDIESGGSIEAGWSIKSGGNIKSGGSIKASGSIEAGSSIKAVSSIESGLSIVCKTLSARLRIFAGLCVWRLPDIEEKQIVCEELQSGEICYGQLVLKKTMKNLGASIGQV